VISLCRDWGIPVVVLYGGGYNRVEGMTTELHCQTVRAAARRFEREAAVTGEPELNPATHAVP
jgi:hypothetical protein